MATQDSRLETDGFVPFYRSYTKTWIHAVATAGLTAFGTLTIVHRWFAALALASYVVPPILLYLRHGRGDRSTPDRDAAGAERGETAVERREAAAESPEPEPAEPASDSERTEPTATNGLERDETGARVDSSDGTDGAVAEERERPSHRQSRPSRESPDSPSATTAERGAETAAEAETKPETEIEPEAKTEPETETESEAETEPQTETEPETAEWHAVDAPTDATLRDVTVTDPNGPSSDPDSSVAYAVGGDGIVLATDGSADDGDGWTTVLEDGPAAGGNALRGVDATADGAAVWVAGDSGALGRIDAETGRHTDYTAPEDVTDNWLGVAVDGADGDETVLLINGSGAVLRGEYGDDGSDGPALEWTGPDKPGSGSSFSGIALADAVGYCCDTNDGVYETTDGGESFDRVGLEGADGTLTDVATGGRGDCLVSADDGVVHRYGGATWTPERVADGTLSGITRRGEGAVACGADGAVYERADATASWERTDTDASAPLLAVSLGTDRAVAVGEDGTVVVRC